MERPTASDVRNAIAARHWLWPAWRSQEANLGDRVFRWLAAFAALSVVVLLFGITAEMARAAASSLERFGFGFVSSSEWDPVRDSFGALPFIYGTLVSSALALLIAVPISLGVAVFLSELAPGFIRRPLGFLVELLAAIPSVVYGLWGVFVLAPWMREVLQPILAEGLGFLPLFQGPTRGFGLLAGGIILAIMILPTIASVSRDVMRAVPGAYREAALAMGATRWETVRLAVLPIARSGIVGAILLGLGRALGETMAVTMVIGNRAEITASLFGPGATLASVIANEYTEASGDLHLAALSELGLLLFGVTLLLNICARVLVWRVSRIPGGRRAL